MFCFKSMIIINVVTNVSWEFQIRELHVMFL